MKPRLVIRLETVGWTKGSYVSRREWWRERCFWRWSQGRDWNLLLFSGFLLRLVLFHVHQFLLGYQTSFYLDTKSHKMQLAQPSRYQLPPTTAIDV